MLWRQLHSDLSGLGWVLKWYLIAPSIESPVHVVPTESRVLYEWDRMTSVVTPKRILRRLLFRLGLQSRVAFDRMGVATR